MKIEFIMLICAVILKLVEGRKSGLHNQVALLSFNVTVFLFKGNADVFKIL